MSIDFAHLKKVFFEECQDLLQTAEENLSNIASGNFSLEDIHAVFRSVHSIKGGAGSFGFNNLVSFAHILETLLDHLRDERIALTTEIGDLLLRGNDVLADFVRAAREESGVIPEFAPKVQKLLEDIVGGHGSDTKHDTPANKTVVNPDLQLNSFKIQFIPHETLMQFGNEPMLILRELRSLNEETAPFKLTANTRKIPAITQLQADLCYLSWDIHLVTERDEKFIREVFEFVEDDCNLTISSEPYSDTTAGSTESQVVAQEESADAKKTAQPSATQATTTAQAASPSPKPAEEAAQSIRVDLDRIDKLVNTVGEMVIKQAMVLDRAALLNSDGENDLLMKGLHELTQHTRDLQESVMAIRAQPVKAVFSRVPRLVRELSAELKKDIQVIMHGENTEIDKTVIEKLGEPLTHMIRNSIDHGIETPEERIAKGKNPQGTITLLAEHRSGRIVIEIIDDGKGINRQRVTQKAIENGLISQEQATNLSGEEIDNLVFLPGFSTAQEVTNISGRGVGMDVVKRSIQSLGGRINITSIEGVGCTFTLTLPLTLAVLDGMIVTCADENYIIPIINIIETVRPGSDQVTRIVGLHDILHLRGQNIPLVYLHKLFNIQNAIHDPASAIVVVVETEGGELIGLVVDELLNQQQVVIKSLEENYDPIGGISAATILGNGRVALILDVSALKQLKTN